MKKYLIECDDDQDVIEAENYQEALQIACGYYNICVSDVTEAILGGERK